MGIVNVTPDSFSDGGRRLGAATTAVAHAPAAGRRGGRPARPRRRVEPARGRAGAARRGAARGSSRWSRRWRAGSIVPISVDTTKAEVARRALEAGASIINDITAPAGRPRDGARSSPSRGGGRPDAHAGHAPDHAGRPALRRRGRARSASSSPSGSPGASSGASPATRIAIDPGIGFGKTLEHNLELLRNLDRFANLGVRS